MKAQAEKKPKNEKTQAEKKLQMAKEPTKKFSLDMNSWTVEKLKDYLRRKGARLTGNRSELLDLAKCYAAEPEENPAIIAQ